MIFSCFAASTVKCTKPRDPDHGRYKPDDRTFFKINEVITAVCNIGYYLWKEPATKKCCGLENGDSAWLPKSSKCSDSTSSDSSSSDSVILCLKPELFDEECKRTGRHAVILNDKMSCKAASEGRYSGTSI